MPGSASQGLAVQARAAIAATQARLAWWARSFRGVQARFPVMATPPVVTIGNTTSTINGNVNYAVSAKWDSGRVTLAGSARWASDGASPSRASSIVTTFSDNSTSAGVASHRLRFVTDAPAFEIPIRSTAGQLNALVDGEFVTRSRGVIPEFPLDGAVRQAKFDFGADASAYYAVVAAKAAGGSGYAVGDTITLAGGTGTAATLLVTAVSAGAVASASVLAPGSYSAVPANLVAQASSTGAGTGATFTVYWAKSQTTRRLRRIEVLIPPGGYGQVAPIAGVNINTAKHVVLPWPVSTRVPRLLVLGDSQQSTFTNYAGGNPAATIAQRLGLWDGLVLTNNGGTGYLAANAPALPWSDARRIADIVAQAPDIVLILGGQNDAPQAAATLTAAVTAMLNTLTAALPGALFVGIGAVTANTAALQAAIAAGWAGAAAQSRVRFIDHYALPWIGSGRVTGEANVGNGDNYVASDSVHLTQEGCDWWAEVAAPLIADALLAMIG